MKGLLIKDLCLLMKQKITLLLWLGMTVFFVVLNHDITFGASFGLFLSSILLVGTISYDDYENGMGFLMTLPISRKTYVMEKYVLVIAGILCVGLLVTGLGAAYVFASPNNVVFSEVLLTLGIMFLISILYTGFMIPIQLKFGAEKGRIFMALFAGVIVLLGSLLSSNTNLQLIYIIMIGSFSEMSLPVVIGIFAMLAVAVELISVKISLGIIEKEEY